MSAPIFYIGLHMPHQAAHFPRACLSINRLRRRRKPISCEDVIIDSAAFTELAKHGRYRHGPEEYASALRRLHNAVRITIAVSQDYMCEPFMLAKTGLTVAEHQRLTIERYDALIAEGLPFPIMPVLQGYQPEEYAAHVRAYGDRLKPGMWVGVGSVCKRNGRPEAVLAVLWAIHAIRPDLRLHGFGVKQTSLEHPGIRSLLYSADSMAWSFAARKQGRDGNSIIEAKSFAAKIGSIADRAAEWWQPSLNLCDVA
jgi:hypothetical protein